MKGYTLRDFIRETRPDGKGHIIVSGPEGEDPADIEFDEVVCDSCNDLITQPEDEPNKIVVYADDWGALCLDCYKKRIEKR